MPVHGVTVTWCAKEALSQWITRSGNRSAPYPLRVVFPDDRWATACSMSFLTLAPRTVRLSFNPEQTDYRMAIPEIAEAVRTAIGSLVTDWVTSGRERMVC